jgi:hypothetical protein
MAGSAQAQGIIAFENYYDLYIQAIAAKVRWPDNQLGFALHHSNQAATGRVHESLCIRVGLLDKN